MKKMLFVVLFSIFVGGGLAFFIFDFFVIKDDDVSTQNIVSAFQVGAFTNSNNAEKVAMRNNGIVIQDEDIYRVYVAILYDKVAIKKLSDYYQEIGLNYYLKELKVTDEFILSISDSEELLKKSSVDTYSTINLNVLKMYEEML